MKSTNFKSPRLKVKNDSGIKPLLTLRDNHIIENSHRYQSSGPRYLIPCGPAVAIVTVKCKPFELSVIVTAEILYVRCEKKKGGHYAADGLKPEIVGMTILSSCIGHYAFDYDFPNSIGECSICNALRLERLSATFVAVN